MDIAAGGWHSTALTDDGEVMITLTLLNISYEVFHLHECNLLDAVISLKVVSLTL